MSNFLEKFISGGKKPLQEYDFNEPEIYNSDNEINKPEDNINNNRLTEEDCIDIEDHTYCEEIEIGGDDTWEEYEPTPPPKRRVMGVVKRKPFLPHQVSKEQYATMSPPPPVMIDTAIPSPQQYMAEMGIPRYSYQTPRISPEQQVREQIKQEMLYRQEMEKMQRLEMMRNRPRETTSKKMLRVANQFARGDGGGSNIQIDTTYFKKPKVSVPSPQAQRGERTLDALNNTIRAISPKAATSSKKKKR